MVLFLRRAQITEVDGVTCFELCQNPTCSLTLKQVERVCFAADLTTLTWDC